VRIFIAGVTGVLGRRIAPLLVAEGHEVTGLSRSGHGREELGAQGIDVVVGDVYDRDAVVALMRAQPVDVVLNLLTDLPDREEELAARRAGNGRIRRVGTEHLLAGAAAAGAGHFVTESIAWTAADEGGRAVQWMEDAVLAVDGVVVRYGQLYGPGTWYPDEPPAPPRVHVEDAAQRTLPALTLRKQILTLVDDD
jgi:nucleoside-diphosphate-sugar epimerase